LHLRAGGFDPLMVSGSLATIFTEGGKPSFAAYSINGSYAQIATFAKSRWHRVIRHMPQ